MFALILPAMMIILGFTIDYANIQRVRTELRVVADMSAKCAASNLAQNNDPDQAISAAQQVASANLVGGQPYSLNASDIVFGRSVQQFDGSYAFTEGALPFDSVRVNANRSENRGDGVNLFFGWLYGRDEISLAQSATAGFQHVDIVLVLDRSGSMKWKTVGNMTPAEFEDIRCKKPNAQSRWKSLDDAIQVFLNTLKRTPVQEKIGMVTFASDYSAYCGGITTYKSSLDQALTTDMTKIEAAMDRYNTTIWDGGTNIFAGLNEARLHIEANRTANAEQYIVVLTDGGYNDGGPPFDEATRCRAAGITVHTITFSDQANQQDMKQTATNGGGQHYHAVNEEELTRVFEQIAGSFAILTQ